ncbi:MAG: class I SAM-dependent methyltransferase [Prolixibacteraceae bacterium]
MNEFWNTRYAAKEYAYGEKPNEFLKKSLLKLPPGKILLPAEGEGRNAVFAAQLGWSVFAFDSSIEGKKKADQLALKHGVSINYQVCSFEEYSAENNSFDCVGFTFVHTPAAARTSLHRKSIEWLKPDGRIILQAFSKEQINENSGGPREVTMLYSKEELEVDFEALSSVEIENSQEIIQEGIYHKGMAKVINLIGAK